MVADAKLVEQSIRESVQGFPPIESVKAGSTFGWGFYTNGGAYDIVSAYGTLQCDYDLKRFYRRPYNTLAQGVISTVAKKLAATPFEITGSKSKKSLANRFTLMLQNGQYGMGWTDLIKMTIADYCILNRGATWEIIAPGDPTKPIDYADVVGFAIKDGLRCIPTGHPEYPVVYRTSWMPDKKEEMYYALHKSRCARFVDMPDSDELLFGLGMSALYRVVGIAYTQVLMSKYQVEKLSDLPPEGFMTVKGLNDVQFGQAMAAYESDRRKDGQNVFRGLMRLVGFDAELVPEVNITPFSSAPDNFNYKEYMDMHVNMFALAFGVDKQEIWELASSGMGSATQSAILHAKGMGKFYADCMSMIERAINQVLPDSLTFEFKFRDEQADREIADRATVWMDLVSTAGNILSKEQQLKLLANNVEQFAEVIYNEDGELDLNDEQTPAQTETPNTAITPETPAQSTPVDTEIRDEIVLDDTSKATKRKEWSSTLDDFVTDVKDAIAAGNDGDVTRRRFGTLMRGLLQRYGQEAYKDGMRDGGVEVDALESEALADIMKWQSEQSSYVTSFGDSVYKDGLSGAGVDSHARMWGNKSLKDVYYKGLAAADTDGMYEWVIGATEQHCTDCKRLNGVRARLSTWQKSKYRPQGENLSCKGYHCKCSWKRVRGRSRGTI